MFRMHNIVVLSLPIILAGCLWSVDPVAKMQVTVDGETEQYFSYLPPERGSDKRPTCGWRSGWEATKKPDKTLKSYETIYLACSFDVSDKTRIQSKYGFSFEFRRNKRRKFEAVLAVVGTSSDGLIINSNLMKGKPPGWRCKEKNCGIKFSKINFPDLKDRSGVLEFDINFSAPMTRNLSDKTVYTAEFQLTGEVMRHYPN